MISNESKTGNEKAQAQQEPQQKINLCLTRNQAEFLAIVLYLENEKFIKQFGFNSTCCENIREELKKRGVEYNGN